MPPSLSVIALISGGKDSLYSILHCVKYGHNVVALANLHPPLQPETQLNGSPVPPEEQDMNSFMYQTVGHSFIPSYAEALGLPLYRREIAGEAVLDGQDYDASLSSDRLDETEDLFFLLQKVKMSHPNADAVCSGAILSAYQRSRIESVAVRLGLTPLAFLWQYPALPPAPGTHNSDIALLNDMHAAGCDARLIKVASGGLDESMLWSNVASPRTRNRLVSALSRFFPDYTHWQRRISVSMRGAFLGEGGEYETLAIDGPPVLWKKRIHIDDDQVSKSQGGGGTYYAHISKVTLVVNEVSNNETGGTDVVRQPALLDLQFSGILDLHRNARSATNVVQLHKHESVPPPSRHAHSTYIPLNQTTTNSVSHFSMANVTAPDAGSQAATQMESIIQKIKTQWAISSPNTGSPSDILATILLLSNMSDFTPVNTIYSTLFIPGKPNPPARITLAADLPSPIKVSLSFIHSKRSGRKGLHVQSRSYWTPANIGPYSQAICEPLIFNTTDYDIYTAMSLEVVHMAGQIPLVPHTMELLNQCFCYQAILSLQHLWRVGQERSVDVWPWLVAFVAAHDEINIRAEIAHWVQRQTYKSLVSLESDDDAIPEGEEDDIWEQRFSQNAGRIKAAASVGGDHLHPLPNADLPSFTPYTIIAEVLSLPRDASIEWWSTGIAGVATNVQHVNMSVHHYQPDVVDQPSEFNARGMAILFSGKDDDGDARLTLRWKEESLFLAVFIPHHQFTNQESVETMTKKVIDWVTCGYKGTGGGHNDRETSSMEQRVLQVVNGTALLTDSDESDLGSWAAGVACVPCKSIWGSIGLDDTVKPLKAALLLRLEGRGKWNLS